MGVGIGAVGVSVFLCVTRAAVLCAHHQFINVSTLTTSKWEENTKITNLYITFYHRLNMELYLQSLLELLCTASCTHWLRLRNSPSAPPPHSGSYEGAIGQPR
jgi:hypothetical protein